MLTVVPPVLAQEHGCQHTAIVLQDAVDHYDLTSCLWYLEDPSHELTIDDIRSDAYRDRFKEHGAGVLNFGYTESAYWIRFQMRYAGDHPIQSWFLELILPLTDEAELFLAQDERLVYDTEVDYEANWDSRDVELPNPTFKLRTNPGKTYTVYLRVYTTNTFRLPLHLWAPHAYAEHVGDDELVQGFFYGGMFAILIYNLFVALVVRERSYVYYVFYLCFALLFLFSEQVHGLQALDEVPPFLHKKWLHIYILLTWFWGLRMVSDVLELKWLAPGLHYFMRMATYGVIATLVLALFIPSHVGTEWTVIASIFLALAMIAVTCRAWIKDIPSARTYFLAWICTCVGVGTYALMVMGLLPLNIFTAHGPQVGFLAQIILFSFALAERIKTTQEQALEWNQTAVSNLQRYRSLFDNAVEGIFQMSPECRFIDANPSMAAMLGYDNVEDMKKHTPDALDACFANDRVRDWVVEQLQSRGGFKGLEAMFRTRDGDERWANVSLRTVYNELGDPTHLEGTFVDVTERKHREQVEKERENERLEKELARNSASAKSQFLANMSHEIRTPLAAIIGYGESLLDPDLSSEEKRNSAETVVRSGRHLLDLINDILDHSKIDANKLDVEILSVNLPELLDEVRAFFAPRAREKGLEFYIRCDYPLPETIQTDPTRFRQILINLCGNALKFTEKGSIHIGIRCDREKEQIVARVVDTGIGMKPEQLERLFDPFAQASAAIARQYGGTGLGLSISKHLAELLGGSIDVRSTYGEGSEFEVRVASGSLDNVHFIRDASEMTQRRRQLPMVEAPQLHGRILCAEDNEVNRKLVDLLVRRTGADIVHVGNGAEALELASHEAFDLILMDIQMPVMNGRDATRALREAGINTPIVALTANVMAEDVQDYREAGCTDYLAKPIDKRRFYELLARFLVVSSDGRRRADTRRFQGTVLVAEDNEDNFKLVERLLKRAGVEVISATSGKSAVQIAMSKTVHMILMDSHMPEMDGPEATQLLRQTGFRRPIIAFTAGDQQEIDELLKAGCDGVLTKPIDNSRLRILLRKHLETVDETIDNAAEESGEDDAIQALVAQFLDGLPERMRIMDQALEEDDWATLQTQAHQIKGTAGAMGYPLMTESAAELERALKFNDHVGAKELYEPLKRQMQQAQDNRATEV
ncbi:response regulator [Marinobacteraceae bacterium S3BR75-40.1]